MTERLSETFLVLKETNEILLKMYIGLDVKCRLFLSYFKEISIFATDIRKKKKNSQLLKIHENPSGESRVVPCGQTDGRTDGRDEANVTPFFAILRTSLKSQ